MEKNKIYLYNIMPQPEKGSKEAKDKMRFVREKRLTNSNINYETFNGVKTSKNIRMDLEKETENLSSGSKIIKQTQRVDVDGEPVEESTNEVIVPAPNQVQKKKAGRPKKYTNPEEAKLKKREQTLASNKRKRNERKEQPKENVIINKKGTGIKEILQDVKEYGKAVIFGREDYPPKVRKILENVKNKNVSSMTIKRSPINKFYSEALKLFLKFNRIDKPYDDLFHLSIELTLEDGTSVMLEKNEVINMVVNYKFKPNTESNEISSPIPSRTLPELLNNTKKMMGSKKFFDYSASDNNCQDFLISFLKSNNIGNKEDYDFIKQDVKYIFESLPNLKKITDSLTGLASRFDVLTQGRGAKIKNSSSNWIEHIRQYAKENNMTYGCALSDPNCSKSYQQKKNKKRTNIKYKKPEQKPEQKPEPKIEQKPEQVIEKNKKPLPPLISDREKFLISSNANVLKKILNEYKSKGEVVKPISSMKKDDLIGEILKIEKIPLGVKWGDASWVYDSLKQAYSCEDRANAVGLRNQKYALNKAIAKLNALKSSDKFDREEFGLLQDNINRYKDNIKTCEDLLERDFEKEYNDYKNRPKRVIDGEGIKKNSSSNWIEHIRQYAKENNMTYGCALSDPNCSKSYQQKKNKKPEPKIEPKIEQKTTENIKIKPKENVKIKPTPIKQTTTDDLVENWDDPYLGNLVYDTQLGRNFEKLINSKSQVIDVYLLALTKSLNEKIIKRWGVDVLMDGINNIANYLGAENYNMMYGVEPSLPIRKIVGDKVYKMITDANNKKINENKMKLDALKKLEPKIEPKIEPKPLKKKSDPYKWVIEVETPFKQQFPFDFTFSRWFDWKMEKTPKGYINRFKNERDYETAKDITMYNDDYKNRKWYKWIYRGKVE